MKQSGDHAQPVWHHFNDDVVDRFDREAVTLSKRRRIHSAHRHGWRNALYAQIAILAGRDVVTRENTLQGGGGTSLRRKSHRLTQSLGDRPANTGEDTGGHELCASCRRHCAIQTNVDCGHTIGGRADRDPEIVVSGGRLVEVAVCHVPEERVPRSDDH